MSAAAAVAALPRAELRLLALLAAISGSAWLLLAGNDALSVPALCSSSQPWSVSALEAFPAVLAFASPSKLIIGWLLMIVAMMSLTVFDQLRHVRARSFRSMQPRLMLLFAGSYLAVWVLAGAVFIGIGLAIRIAFSDVHLPLALALLGSLIWQASPLKQVALNRCHGRGSLAAFAPAAFVDSVRMGVRQGLWCIASCWPLMLATMLTPTYHLAAMLAVSAWIWAERLEPAGPVRWQLRIPFKAVRLIAGACAGAFDRAAGPPATGPAPGAKPFDLHSIAPSH